MSGRRYTGKKRMAHRADIIVGNTLLFHDIDHDHLVTIVEICGGKVFFHDGKWDSIHACYNSDGYGGISYEVLVHDR